MENFEINFVNSYYETMLQRPAGEFCKFFDEISHFSHSENYQSSADLVALGKDDILKVITTLNFSEVRLDITSFETQQIAYNVGFVVLVTGQFTRNGQETKQFTHSLILFRLIDSNTVSSNDKSITL